VFLSLPCLSGFSPRTQDDRTVSVWSTRLAVYSTKRGSKAFGKMVTSSQGPKSSQVMYCALHGPATGIISVVVPETAGHERRRPRRRCSRRETHRVDLGYASAMANIAFISAWLWVSP
jgi:hypothetical protein